MQRDPRRATRNDLPAVERIIQAAYSHYIERIGRKPGPMLDDYAALIGGGQVYVIEHHRLVKGKRHVTCTVDADRRVRMRLRELI